MIDSVERTSGLRFAGLLAALILLPTPGVAGNSPSCPEGGTKIDLEGPAEFSCGEGEVLTGICVKAGRDGFGVGDGEAGNGSGCYAFSGVGGAAGSVAGGGTGPDCKTISHTVYYCGPGEPEPEPFCGDGVIEGIEQCDPPGRIDELLVCNEECQIVEVPSPEPEPFCGNQIIEAGEDCDPPGRIDELFSCSETCQIIEDPLGGGGEEPGGEEPN